MIHKVVKLSDFGVTGELVDSPVATSTGTSFHTAASELSSRYPIIRSPPPDHKPERICGHEYIIRSDVRSTGITLFEQVQNRFPFPKFAPHRIDDVYYSCRSPRARKLNKLS